MFDLSLDIINTFRTHSTLDNQGLKLAKLIRSLPIDCPDPSEKAYVIRGQFQTSWSCLEDFDFEGLIWTDSNQDSFARLEGQLAICSACATALDGQAQLTENDTTMIASGIMLLLTKCMPKKAKDM